MRRVLHWPAPVFSGIAAASLVLFFVVGGMRATGRIGDGLAVPCFFVTILACCAATTLAAVAWLRRR
ncbi:hypothetical protein GSY69_00740 [Brevibacterium sp. 5221]|uniref:Uncharacterized protein n=1 Tax=Brevibacterium rongguiense TaxID=2695267 RepID=A0A6N9H3C4_9MICO|nr:hypothetical protein [Brevibacterium sp. BRM-1]MYM18540.1 hypothetical protein [Brevibacterium rongguiense]WAL39611.1 hypothetical protein BRM1_10110 [Brevibacterium sp. BRM-1]